MLFFTNIRSVATYESKLLIRSWFFKVFTVLAILFITFYNIMNLTGENSSWNWQLMAIPANLPYMNLMILNVGQAIIAIFLASDFLKRDKKLDTSEVFYVHPLSNAEYVLGKIWGNMRVFILLNAIILGIAFIFNFVAEGVSVDFPAYLYYFLIISVPTLIYIFGLSIFLMLALKNQALTFVILLGYIGISVFYIEERFFGTFDYMTLYFPILKSTIIGFPNLQSILLQRGIYLLLGLTFIALTIVLFKRLPNSWKSSRPWIVIAILLFAGAFASAWTYVSGFKTQDSMRKRYTEVNNKYVNSPKMVVDDYKISVEQHESSLSAQVAITGKALAASDKFTFTLNPGLQVTGMTRNGKDINYETDHQILTVDMGEQIAKDSTISLTISYEGIINPNICYLDIPEETRTARASVHMFTYDKQYAVQKPNFLLLTPETYWYPRAGTSYSSTNPSWQQTYFSRFELDVKPLPGLTPVSQGAVTLAEDSTTFRFVPEFPLQSATLVIANYEKRSIVDPKDSVEYSIYNVVGNDIYTAAFDSIKLDTIPTLIQDVKNNIYRQLKLEYPFKRFSIVEVPLSFSTYERTWTQAHETMQPEMVLYPERASKSYDKGLVKRKKLQKKWAKDYENRELSDAESEIRLIQNFLWEFNRSEGNMQFNQSSRGKYNISSGGSNPYYIFPQLYNFKYNIYSDEWSIANRMIEVYLQKTDANSGFYDWRRDFNGISDNEKASLLMQKRTFKDLISDPEQRPMVNSFLELKAGLLFAPVEQAIGVVQFRDTIYEILEQNRFRNIKFETLLDSLSGMAQTDLKPQIANWNEKAVLPVFEISTPDVIRVKSQGTETYELMITFSNTSDYPGTLKMDIPKVSLNAEDGKEVSRIITLEPGECKREVIYFEEFPNRVNVNTLVSGNLPSLLNMNVQDVTSEKRDYRYPEGETVIDYEDASNPDEIIVDNEDEQLFELSKSEPIGYLPRWLDQTVKSEIKYSGISWWNPPIEWTVTTGNNYFGKAVRSAHVIKSGKGSQTATWKIPLPEKGEYDLFYYFTKPQDMRWGGRGHEKREYRFKIDYDKETEEAFLDMNRSDEGWVQLGTYFFDSDTVRVTLDNKVAGRAVIADAVKLESRIIGREKKPSRRSGQRQFSISGGSVVISR